MGRAGRVLSSHPGNRPWPGRDKAAVPTSQTWDNGPLQWSGSPRAFISGVLRAARCGEKCASPGQEPNPQPPC